MLALFELVVRRARVAAAIRFMPGIEGLVADPADRSAAPVTHQRKMIANDVALLAASETRLLVISLVADTDLAHFLVADRLDRLGIGDHQITKQQIVERVETTARIDHVAHSQRTVILRCHVVVGMIERHRLAVQAGDRRWPEDFVGQPVDHDPAVRAALDRDFLIRIKLRAGPRQRHIANDEKALGAEALHRSQPLDRQEIGVTKTVLPHQPTIAEHHRLRRGPAGQPENPIGNVQLDGH